MNPIPFINSIGYIRSAIRAQRPDPSGHTVHLRGVRRDLWLTIQNSILRAELLDVQRPDLYKGRTDMARAGKEDIRIGKWDTDIHHLFELKIIGECLNAPGFENAVMDKLLWTYRKFYQENEGRVPLGIADYVFECSENTCLRNFVLDILIFAMSNKTAAQAVIEGHLSQEVVESMVARGSKTTNEVRDAPWNHPSEYQQPLMRLPAFT
jgi:hypothetical protein